MFQLLRFFLVMMPIAVLAVVSIVLFNPWLLVPWVLLLSAFFGFVEIRVMCSHCPHYAEPEAKSLKCWANYGAPKLWKYHPGPMNAVEKTTFFAGFVLLCGFPAVLGVLGGHYIVLALLLLSIVLAGVALRIYYCNRCMNFACPFNSVKREARDLFFGNNPVVEKAWKGVGDNEA